MSEDNWGPYCQVRPRALRKPIADAVEELAKCLGVAPKEAWAKLRAALVTGDVKAYWRPSSDPNNNPIAPDRWPRALIEIKKQTVILAEGKRMTFIDVDRQDFEALLGLNAAPISPRLPPKSKRFSKDDELVAEGAAGMKAGKWPNPHRAAAELAERAEGNATVASKISRIETKIRNLQNPRNISKHLK